MQPNKIDILDVATYLVKHQNKDDFTRMKIQKLVFLTYCKYLLKYNIPMFENDFEAWEEGPISLPLYLEQIKYPTKFDKTITFSQKYDENKFTKEHIQIMNRILKKHGSKPLRRIYDFIHKENGPWRISYKKKDVSQNSILDSTLKQCYLSKKHII
ncbi:Panacea domain-containing protein [Candidatus Phytoplasma australiense]|uniref:Phage-Associated Protein n=1 Tax=Strawberry lethal yellows phytoplasma (CPA) str. NZSb11 TaxID=980422 RepID=R4S215_PHYAS|nr:type II toxin-antitoxin system antitoxin SocA domain-containing protein [Candidatus Phytoplasma australiense]AGL90859.1 Phage-Associated Protein [Strawberry lethal yellows phytoplasma (CPA) str. NZSb11]